MTEPAAARSTPAEIAARSGSSFLIGFRPLAPRAREAMTAIYAFCRVIDDAVDDAADPAQGAATLSFWRDELELARRGEPRTPIGRGIASAMREFEVSPQWLSAVVEGMAMDLEPPSYRTLADLEVYCHRVASAVGLACLPVMGVRSESGRRFADRLGLALQWTNILRDVRFDAERGRIYLPRTWLEHCGVDPRWLLGNGPASAYAEGGAVARLCARAWTVAERRFAEAADSLRGLSGAERRKLMPARVMSAIYRDLLARLRERAGDLSRGRIRVSNPRKAWLAIATRIGLGA
ncbi:MAG: presqualene diphosphate synthase HpnD [Planctomycetota bacterium]